MQRQITTNISVISTLAVAISGLCAERASAGGSDCTTGSVVKVCVEWSQGVNPMEGTDYSVSFADPSNPAVELSRADLEWVVYATLVSSPSTPANIGTLALKDPTPAGEDFEVTIANGAGAGAANVRSIILNHAGFTGYSSIEGGSIGGNLTGGVTGALTIVQDSVGNGGELTLMIVGDVLGPINVPVVKGLTITGDLTADLTVSDKVTAPGLDIDGNVSASVVISIANQFPSGTNLEIGSANTQFEGQLDLLNGVPNGTIVKILSDIGSLTSTPVIDLHNQGVIGRLECLGDNAGNIINGNEVKNLVTLASGTGNAFSGTATFTLIRETGRVDTTSSADLDGTLHMTNYVDGDVLISGDVGKDGKIWIEGDLPLDFSYVSEVVVDGNVAGDIVIDGTIGEDGFVYLNGTLSGRVSVGLDMEGLIDIDGNVQGDVDIDGSLDGLVELWAALAGRGRILVDGLSPGNITIHKQTDSLTLIHLLEGIDVGGRIIINRDAENFNAGGVIHVGPESLIGSPGVTFDGLISILDEQGTGNGGDLTGSIVVVGCHADSTDLEICIAGGDGGENVDIQQSGCPHQVNWSCTP